MSELNGVKCYTAKERYDNFWAQQRGDEPEPEPPADEDGFVRKIESPREKGLADKAISHIHRLRRKFGENGDFHCPHTCYDSTFISGDLPRSIIWFNDGGFKFDFGSGDPNDPAHRGWGHAVLFLKDASEENPVECPICGEMLTNLDARRTESNGNLII